MEFIRSLVDFVLHIDAHLVEIVNDYQTLTYLILFLSIFAETGLVVSPILPGDSLLFAAGAIIAKPETDLSIGVLWIVLCVAAVLGDRKSTRLNSSHSQISYAVFCLKKKKKKIKI